MGKVKRGAEPLSGGSTELTRKNSQIRPKREQRTNLDELHHNVLEAKRNLRRRARQRKRSKTNFTNVLTNFADRRRENENGDQLNGAGKGKKTKPRVTCDRLLPEPMVGIYKNGAKGREISRVGGRLNGKNAARRRNDVMKLLDGDETNPKKRGTIEKKRTTRAKPATRQMSKYEESDSEIEIGRLNVNNSSSSSSNGSVSSVSSVNTISDSNSSSIFRNKMKGNVKRINRKKERINGGNDEIGKVKNQLTKVTREKDEEKCKRRLFETNDEKKIDKNSFGIIDFPRIMDEKRFSLNQRVNIIATSAADESKIQKNNVTERANKSIEITNNHIFSLPPVLCYENFCGMMCANHFENKHHRYKVPDRTVNIQKRLKGFYMENRRKLAKKNVPVYRTITPTTMMPLKESCGPYSEMVEDVMGESTIKIGSWHPPMTTKINRINDESPINEIKDSSTIDSVQQTINSVSLFLKQFEKYNSSKETEKSVPMELPKISEVRNKNIKLNDNFDLPISDLTFDLNLKTLVGKNKKYVPTILRRSNGCSGRSEEFEKKKQLLFPRVAEQRIVKKVTDKRNNLIPIQRLSENRSKKETSFSPVSTLTLSSVSSNTTIQYSDHDEIQRGINKNNLNNNKANVSRRKLNLVEEYYKSSVNLDSGDIVRKTIEMANGNETRQVEFAKRVNMENDKSEVNRMNVPMGQETVWKKVTLFNEPNRFFNENDNRQRANNDSSIQQRRDNFLLHHPNNFVDLSTSTVSSMEFQSYDQQGNYPSYDGQNNDRREKYSSRCHNEKINESSSSSRNVNNHRQESNSRVTSPRVLKNYRDDSREELREEPRYIERNISKSSKESNQQNEKSVGGLCRFLADKDPTRINAHLETECLFLGCNIIDQRNDMKKRVSLFMPDNESYRALIELRNEIIKYKSMGFSYQDGQEHNFRLNGFHYIYFPRVQNKLIHQSSSNSNWQSAQNQQYRITQGREIFQDSQPTKFLAFDGCNDTKAPRRIPMYANVEPISNVSVPSVDTRILNSRISNNESKKSTIIYTKPPLVEYQIGTNRKQKAKASQLNGHEQLDVSRTYELQDPPSNFYNKNSTVFLYSNDEKMNDHRRVSRSDFHQEFNANEISSIQSTSNKSTRKNVSNIIYNTDNCQRESAFQELRYKMPLKLFRDETNVPSRINQQPRYNNETSLSQGSTMGEKFPKIIQLPDGTVRIFIDDNFSINNRSECDCVNARPISNHTAIINGTDSANSEEIIHQQEHHQRHLCDLANKRFNPPSGYQ